MRRAARFADGWDAPYAEPASLREGVSGWRRVCEEMGRDPSSTSLSVRGLAADGVDGATVEAYATLGVTDLGVMLPCADAAGAVASLRALARRVPGHLAPG